MLLRALADVGWRERFSCADGCSLARVCGADVCGHAPDAVPGPFVSVSASGCAFAYGVRANGSIQCWGQNPWLRSGFNAYDIDVISGWN